MSLTTLYPHFKSLIHRHLQPSASIVVAFSGGVDSRVLLELVSMYKTEFGTGCKAVHVHHGLSQHADAWSEKCQQWSSDLNIVCYVEKVTLSDNEKGGLEQKARNARYQALSKHLAPNDLLLTGQHGDDQVETFLLALKRGSGPKGLSSMAEVMPFGIALMVRPLLSFSREQIEHAAQASDLDWVEDESNQDTSFDRNFLRQNILPELNQRWSGFRSAVNRSARLCAEQEALLDELLAAHLELAVNHDGSLSIESLSRHSLKLQARIVRMWLAQLDVKMPSEAQLKLIWSDVIEAKQDANPQLNISGGSIRRFQDALYWVTKRNLVNHWQSSIALNTPLELPEGLGELTLEVTTSGDICLPEHPQELQVIFEPMGLSAHPQERAHSRKLKKLFQEYQIPSWQRREMPILVYRGKVVAVANLFIDKAFAGSDAKLKWTKK